MIVLYTVSLVVILQVVGTGIISAELGFGVSPVFCVDATGIFFFLTLTSVSVSVLTWSYFYIGTETIYRRFLCIVLVFRAVLR